jgi:citrate synthase
MTQIEAFLASDLSVADYVQGLRPEEARFFGFGHRIHKTSETDAPELLGKDPRVSLYIRAAKEGFPDKAGKIDKMIAYAQAIRKVRRSLGANSDFGAAVLFHALELSPRVAEGFFAAFRCVGVCANVVNELQIKGNSRRPPFAEVLPYPAQ